MKIPVLLRKGDDGLWHVKCSHGFDEAFKAWENALLAANCCAVYHAGLGGAA